MDEIEVYKSSDIRDELTIRLDKETVWLNRELLAALFDLDDKTISKHVGTELKMSN
jgi:hypothetical protein